MHTDDATPSAWIIRFASLIREKGRVLDVAAGRGRHARFFACHGFRVLAVDRDAAALASMSGMANVDTLAADLETGLWPLPARRFDAIIVCNYLHRPLWPHLLAALAPDGILLYETFAIGNERYGKPSNPDFLLRPAELLDVFGAALTIVAFEQGELHHAGRGAVVQRVAAAGTARPWPPALEA